MKFQIKLEIIKDYLKRMSSSVQTSSSRVEFTGVLISVWENSITFEGRNDWMDTKIEITSLTDVKIINTGKALIKANMLNEIVQKMEGKIITFTKGDSSVLTVSDSNSSYQITLLSEEKFEHAKYILKSEKEIIIPANKFKKSISKTEFAGSENNNKFIYQGLNFVINEGKLITTAIDGIRIASWSTNIVSNNSINKIIPLKVARELKNILPESGEYKLSFFENKCLLVSENMTCQFTLIEGSFPMFEKFFNMEMYDKNLVIKKELILNAIDKATVLNKHSESSRIGLIINNESFLIETKDELSFAKVEISNFNFEGEKISISISPKMILDGIKHTDDENINIMFSNETSGVLLKSEKDNFLYLMSPMV